MHHDIELCLLHSLVSGNETHDNSLPAPGSRHGLMTPNPSCDPQHFTPRWPLTLCHGMAFHIITGWPLAFFLCVPFELGLSPNFNSCSWFIHSWLIRLFDSFMVDLIDSALIFVCIYWYVGFIGCILVRSLCLVYITDLTQVTGCFFFLSSQTNIWIITPYSEASPSFGHCICLANLSNTYSLW